MILTSRSEDNPYLIAGPALISFSGGRTSAYMLYQILQAHGGTLPDDVVVAFANTGKEREETLRFVHECGSRWSAPIHWIEWRDDEPCFEVVGFNSAARSGEPFSALIDKKKALPNWQARWCTGFLKVKPMHALMTSRGHASGTYLEIIGLRADEPGRIGDMVERNERDARQCTAPLGKSGVLKRDVLAFWLGQNVDPRDLRYPLPQGFDLGLRDGEGNCTKCFLKGRKLLEALISDDPREAAWWSNEEIGTGATFSSRYSYADLIENVRKQPTFWTRNIEREADAECGLACAA